MSEREATPRDVATTDDHDRSGILIAMIGAALSGFMMGLLVGILI